MHCFDRKSLLVVLAVIVAAVVACSAPAQPQAPHTSARPTPPPPPTTRAPESACRVGVPFYAASPPYAGAGPHRVLGFDLSLDVIGAPPGDIVPPDPPVLPDSWAADFQDVVPAVFEDVPEEIDYQQAQLALCMSQPQVTNTVVGTCSYEPQDGDLINTDDPDAGTIIDAVAASYDFTLFEARTGRLITSFQLTSSDAPTYCPGELTLGEDRYKIAAGPDPDAITTKLQPFVEGPAS